MNHFLIAVADRGGGNSRRSREPSAWTGRTSLAQIVSFSIVCAVLYACAYQPILRMLAARREQIAQGMANAQQIKSELARIEVQRREVLAKADAEGRQLIEDARAAAARVHAVETGGRRRGRADPRQGAGSGGTRARADAGRSQTRRSAGW